MPRGSLIQTAFTSGVLDPLLEGRTDIKHYYEGVQQGDNVIMQIQGGFARRPGSVYHAEVDDPGRIEAFTFNTEQTYIVYFGDLEIKIFKDGVLQSTEVSPYSISEVFELGFTQSADTMIICHEDHQPRQLVRGSAHTDWTLSTITFTNIPLADFNDSDSPAKTEEIHTLTFSTSPAWSSGDYFRLKLADKAETEKIWWTDADSYSLLEKRIRNALAKVLIGYWEDLPDDEGDIRNLALMLKKRRGENVIRIQGLTGAGITVDASGYPDVTVTLDDGDADAYTELQPLSVTAADATMEITLTSALTATGVTRREDAFSADRGWPKYPVFFEGRLWLGGCKAIPQAVFGSVTNLYYDMGLGDSLDDEGIFIILDTDQANAVTGLVSGRRLHVMTTGGEYVFIESPVTPGTAFLPLQTDYGSLPIKPVILEGSAIFVHSRGKQVMEMTYGWQEDAFNTRSVSLLSQHLIKTPVDMAGLRGTSLEAANYLYIVNTDGTIAVMLSSKAQEVAAWAHWTTDGNYKSVAVAEEEVYVLVERTIQGSSVYYLEQSTTTALTDSAVLQTHSPAVSSLTGLDHLDDETVKVRGDGGVLLPDETVSAGAVTLSQSVSSVEVGINYIPTVETMVPNANFGQGASLSMEKRITRVDALLYKTRGLTVNNQVVPDRQTDVDPLDTAPPERNGMTTVRPAETNWSQLPTVTFTQTDPHPMTVLAAVMKVEANEV